MSSKFCIYGDTIKLKDQSIGNKSSIWNLPDSSSSELKEIDFNTGYLKGAGFYKIGLIALGESIFDFGKQTKMLTVYPNSWLELDYGTRRDTIRFRGSYSSTEGINNFVYAYRNYGENRIGYGMSIARQKTYDLSYAKNSYWVRSIPIDSSYSIPTITGQDTIAFQVKIFSQDTGLVALIYPIGSGIISTTSTMGSYGYYFNNLSAKYFSIRPNQVSDTVNVRISGLIYQRNFKYIPE